jgi:hypothetical protein
MFDLVEDGEWPGWLADRRPGRAASGARVLNVSVTRCRHRLYLIGSERLIRAQTGRPGTALSAIRALLVAERSHVVKAAQLLQVPEAGAPMELDPVADELAETLARHVRVVGSTMNGRTYMRPARDHRRLRGGRHRTTCLAVLVPQTQFENVASLIEPAIIGSELGTRDGSPHSRPMRIRSSPGGMRGDVQSSPPRVPALRFVRTRSCQLSNADGPAQRTIRAWRRSSMRVASRASSCTTTGSAPPRLSMVRPLSAS